MNAEPLGRVTLRIERAAVVAIDPGLLPWICAHGRRLASELAK